LRDASRVEMPSSGAGKKGKPDDGERDRLQHQDDGDFPRE
jgi:hypothetical protein